MSADYSVSISTAKEDRGPATIINAHKDLDFAVEKLAEMLGSLHDRLHPVLREQLEVNSSAERLMPVIDGSPHQVALRQITTRVTALQELIGSLLGRLEL